jgi:hypothetical protein
VLEAVSRRLSITLEAERQPGQEPTVLLYWTLVNSTLNIGSFDDVIDLDCFLERFLEVESGSRVAWEIVEVKVELWIIFPTNPC